MRLYDLKRKKFVTVADSKIVRKETIKDLSLCVMYAPGKGNHTVLPGTEVSAENLIDILPANHEYGIGISKLPNNYYSKDDFAEAYFSSVGEVAYGVDSNRVYAYFDLYFLEEKEVPVTVDVTGDSFQLIIFKK